MRRKNDISYEEEENISKMKKKSGEIKTTDQGFIHLDASEWKQLNNNEKKLIQKYNTRVKYIENYKEVKIPEGVTVMHKARRTHENNNEDERSSKF